MRLLLKKEFELESDLRNYIACNFDDVPEYRCAVIGMLFDKDGNVIFQRRGPKSRDGNGKLAEIGGAVEEYDKTFKDALMRELREEVGSSAEISIDNFIGGILQNKYDSRTGKDVNWLFLLYQCTYVNGELRCNEEGKSLGYEVYGKDDLPYDEMLDTTKYFWDYYNNGYNKCYSYVMGIGDKIKNLDATKFDIVSDDGDYEITFDKKYELEYKKFIVENLEVGYWNEYYVDDQVIFYFKESEKEIRRYILNQDNNEEILVKCKEFAEADFVSIRQMYIDTPFYKKHMDGVVFYD